jgi:hypothetical protein
MANLAWGTFLLAEFVRHRRPFERLERRQTRHVAVYVVWAWTVVLAPSQPCSTPSNWLSSLSIAHIRVRTATQPRASRRVAAASAAVPKTSSPDR